MKLTERTPDYSSLTRVRDRLMLKVAAERGLLKGKTLGIDSTTFEADAAMKSIVRRNNDEDWQQYVTRLMREEGVIEKDDEPSDEGLRRFDQKRRARRSRMTSGFRRPTPTRGSRS